MNPSTKLAKLKHMRSACLKLQLQHGELIVYRGEGLPKEDCPPEQLKLLIKEARTNRLAQAKALEVRIIALKNSIQKFIKRHNLDPAIANICFTEEEKARRKPIKSTTQTALFVTV